MKLHVLEACAVLVIWIFMHGQTQAADMQSEIPVQLTVQEDCAVQIRQTGQSDGAIQVRQTGQSDGAIQVRQTEKESEEWQTEKQQTEERQTEEQQIEKQRTEQQSAAVTNEEGSLAAAVEEETINQTEFTAGQSEEQTDVQSESEDERDEETEKPETIWIGGICPTETYKVYDGTDRVELSVTETKNLPEGITVIAEGLTQQTDVGSAQIAVQIHFLDNEMNEIAIETDNEGNRYIQVGTAFCPLQIEEAELTVEIVPRPLYIEIADAKKVYYSDVKMKNLRFEEGQAHICVKGFLECDLTDTDVPEDFVYPQITINETVLQKDSPMYRNGKDVVYANALIVKTMEDGTCSGNPTGNYCFVTDPESEYYHTGSVTLTAAPITGTQDYELKGSENDNVYQDENGILWVRSGTGMYAEVKKKRGYTHGNSVNTLWEDGSWQVILKRYSSDGELLAESLPQTVSYAIDRQAPTASIMIDREISLTEQTGYYAKPTGISLEEIVDRQSGVASVTTYLDRDAEELRTPEEVYAAHGQDWGTERNFQLSQEGRFRLYVRLEDHTGNVSYLVSGLVILDFASPVLHVNGIKNGGAYNGIVAPEIICNDMYYLPESLQVTLAGQKNGERKVIIVREEYEGGAVVRIPDLPHERISDDNYTMHVQATDLAGNRAELQISFSVNRFGSTYRIAAATQDMLSRYYLREAENVIIRETNLNDLAYTCVQILYEDSGRILHAGKDYQVRISRLKNGQKEYTYTIPVACFADEGSYYVVVSSKDRAGNYSNSNGKRMRIEFVIDRTPPDVFIDGVENGIEYPQNEKRIRIHVRDRYGVAASQVLLNEKEISGLKCVAETNTEMTWEALIKGADDEQRLTMSFADPAGNTTALPPITFHLRGEDRRKPEEAYEAIAESENGTGEEISEEPVMKRGSAFQLQQSGQEQVKKEPAKASVSWRAILIFSLFLGICGGFYARMRG